MTDHTEPMSAFEAFGTWLRTDPGWGTACWTLGQCLHRLRWGWWRSPLAARLFSGRLPHRRPRPRERRADVVHRRARPR
jgi:hypothetical protein